MTTGRTVRLEDLIGRRVRSVEGVVGRIEEVIAERHSGELQVVEFHLGPGSLLERWSLARLRRRTRTIIVRWDQIDIENPNDVRLTCGPDELEKRSG
jgi:hypothetical protein